MATRIVMMVLVAAAMVGLAFSKCPAVPWGRHGWPLLSDQKFLTTPLTAPIKYCSMCGMQLCTMPQLHEAYMTGFRSVERGVAFAKEGFGVNFSNCLTSVGCYLMIDSPGGVKSGVITYERVKMVAKAWCCGK
ncbi:uncharacterized protein [Asterias amurensis]|uniref:uncharacterized protein n=1 Tax=Asterias amurensis TaxID=7602 RepID=UPI003AB30BE4